MSGLTQEQRIDLLRPLSQMGSQGRAELEDSGKLRLTFYPVPEHLRMLQPDVVLVVGPRGSGKTEISRVLTDANLVNAVSSFASGRIPFASKTAWLKGHPLGREGFDAGGLRRFLAVRGHSLETAQNIWFAYLVRCVRECLDGESRSQVAGLIDAEGGAVDEVYGAWQRGGQAPLLALDSLDKRLEGEGRHLFVSYDELDVIAGQDWQSMTLAIRGLVAFWAAYARRWQHLRAKIFLRTDLYERFAVEGGADLAKLAAGRVELSWSDRNLYGMLLKRIANTDSRLTEYVSAVQSIAWKNEGQLGWMPTIERWSDARPMIERMLGPYMGANIKKGLTYRWLLAHVRDGRGRAVPRPLVRLIEEGARNEIAYHRPVKGMRIIHPTSLRQALEKVSTEHVGYARDEWPWIDKVRERIAGMQVPIARRETEERLEGVVAWGEAEKTFPVDDSVSLLDYLIEVGILRERPDGRIDAPDIYLYGLRLKRKGGVRRR